MKTNIGKANNYKKKGRGSILQRCIDIGIFLLAQGKSRTRLFILEESGHVKVPSTSLSNNLSGHMWAACESSGKTLACSLPFKVKQTRAAHWWRVHSERGDVSVTQRCDFHRILTASCWGSCALWPGSAPCPNQMECLQNVGICLRQIISCFMKGKLQTMRRV